MMNTMKEKQMMKRKHIMTKFKGKPNSFNVQSNFKEFS